MPSAPSGDDRAGPWHYSFCPRPSICASHLELGVLRSMVQRNAARPAPRCQISNHSIGNEKTRRLDLVECLLFMTPGIHASGFAFDGRMKHGYLKTKTARKRRNTMLACFSFGGNMKTKRRESRNESESTNNHFSKGERPLVHNPTLPRVGSSSTPYGCGGDSISASIGGSARDSHSPMSADAKTERMTGPGVSLDRYGIRTAPLFGLTRARAGRHPLRNVILSGDQD
jgi:hypothetical protein